MTSSRRSGSACDSCPSGKGIAGRRMGLALDGWDHVIALAGNPNTGKSTLFNALTGLRQHTGNWPGKTVARAEGCFTVDERRYRLVDLPGTYSLLATSLDEEIARDFILFARPDVTVVVVDASRLERNLTLVLQIAEITDRIVVCLNLVDEARRHGVVVDSGALEQELGVPVAPTVARRAQGISVLLKAIDDVAEGRVSCRPRRVGEEPSDLVAPVTELVAAVRDALPGLPNPRWVALRLLDGDERIMQALRTGAWQPVSGDPETLLAVANRLRQNLGGSVHEELAAASYAEASHIATSVVSRSDRWSGRNTDLVVDRIVTHRLWAFPIMFALLAFVFWITISGANVPSSWLSATLVERGHPFLRGLAEAALFPPWLTGVLVDGAYLATAWVVSVMLPPMAIFFPLFTLLEDLGYLPRVAFNLDPLFRRSGAHGRQALTMSMGFGCNAAGVVSTRIIDSPRERMIAILTNNFALCNGRWPSMILLATLFIAAGTSPPAAGLVAAAAVAGVALLGVGLTLAVSWGLSRSVLRGQVSTFSLELPPYRSPRVWQTLYTSLLDRTIFVLGRAAVLAAPAGALIWLTANVQVGGASVAEHLVQALDPPGLFLGMNGVILLAYVIAIPANEIVIPTVLMLTVLVTDLAGSWAGAGVIFETGSALETMRVLQAGGWTALTAVNVMLFSLAHNPCGTTLHTIYRETGSVRWTAVGALLPLAVGGALTFIVTRLWWWCTSLG